MRQKLNENPVAQIAIVGVMILIVGVLFLSKMGGGEEAAPEAGAVPGTTEEAVEPTIATTIAGPGEAPSIPASTAAAGAPAAGKLPSAVNAAYADDKTIAILIVRDGGIDDRLVRKATDVLKGMSRVAFFGATARHISRFAPITGPLGVNQAPALIVVRPKNLNGDRPAPASVEYGFQTRADVRQAIRNAVYRGQTLTYAPN